MVAAPAYNPCKSNRLLKTSSRKSSIVQRNEPHIIRIINSLPNNSSLFDAVYNKLYDILKVHYETEVPDFNTRVRASIAKPRNYSSNIIVYNLSDRARIVFCIKGKSVTISLYVSHPKYEDQLEQFLHRIQSIVYNEKE